MKKKPMKRNQDELNLLKICFKNNRFFQTLSHQIPADLYLRLMREIQYEKHESLDVLYSISRKCLISIKKRWLREEILHNFRRFSVHSNSYLIVYQKNDPKSIFDRLNWGIIDYKGKFGAWPTSRRRLNPQLSALIPAGVSNSQIPSARGLFRGEFLALRTVSSVRNSSLHLKLPFWCL